MSSVGSLTTSFSPLPSCLTDYYRINASISTTMNGQISTYAYLQRGPTSTSDCVPSGFAPTGVYYSPGICPSGYTQACSNVVTAGTVTETQATCCPRSVGRNIPAQNVANDRITAVTAVKLGRLIGRGIPLRCAQWQSRLLHL